MEKKSRAELILDAKRLGLDLDYEPKVVIPNIFACGEKAWAESMKEGIGSSGANAAIGKSPYKSQAEVALEKTYGKSMPIAAGDPDMQYMLDCGHMMEVPLLKWYASSLGYAIALTDPMNPSTSDIKDISEITDEEWKSFDGRGVVCVDHARYAHPRYSYMFTDMDAICFTPNREKYVLECKTTGQDPKEFKWNWKGGVWGDGSASIGNLGYIDQARQHMCVSNTDRCDIIASCGFNASNIVVVTVYRDMEEERKLIDAEGALWNKVLDGEIPSFTKLSDRSYENVSYIIMPEEFDETPLAFPETNRTAINEIFSLMSEISQKQTEIDSKEERINALKIELLKNMGTHSLATMPSLNDGYEIKLEVNKRITHSFDTKRFKGEHPDIAANYIKTSIGEPKLSLKEVKMKERKGA